MNIKYDFHVNVTIFKLVSLIVLYQEILFTPAFLESITCQGSLDELSNILGLSMAKRPLLTSYRSIICVENEKTRMEYFKELAGELKEQVDVRKTISRVSFLLPAETPFYLFNLK